MILEWSDHSTSLTDITSKFNVLIYKAQYDNYKIYVTWLGYFGWPQLVMEYRLEITAMFSPLMLLLVNYWHFQVQ